MAKALFTPAMDNVLKEHYPLKGSEFCIPEILKKTGKGVTQNQIHHRVRVLHLRREKGVVRRQMVPRPMWPDPQDQDPRPEIGIYQVLEYLGYRRTDRRINHTYKVRCKKCGAEVIRTQESLYKMNRKKSQRCASCANGLTLKQRWDQEKNSQALSRLKEWVELNRKIPVTGETIVSSGEIALYSSAAARESTCSYYRDRMRG